MGIGRALDCVVDEVGLGRLVVFEVGFMKGCGLFGFCVGGGAYG